MSDGKGSAPGTESEGRKKERRGITMEQAQTERKPVIFSAIQPSGTITLGNYLGALKNWITLQDD